MIIKIRFLKKKILIGKIVEIFENLKGALSKLRLENAGIQYYAKKRRTSMKYRHSGVVYHRIGYILYNIQRPKKV